MSRRTHIVRLSVALLLVLGAVGSLAVIGYELYLAERPIPPAGDAGELLVTPPLAQKMVLIILDSLREEAARDAQVMPYLNKLATEGASGVAITPLMTLTTMSVVDLGSGMTPPISWSLKNFEAEPFEDENIFALMKAAGHKIAFVGDASWTQLFGQYADYVFSVPEQGWYQGGPKPLTEVDVSILAEARKVLSDPKFSMVVIHVVGTDKAAHKFGAHLREKGGKLSMYGQAAAQFDAHFRDLHEEFGLDRVWWVQSDHGCNLRGNHGGGEEEARRAPFVVHGPGIVPQADLEISLNAVAPTMTSLFGLRPPRVAEVPAVFSLINHSQENEKALAVAHLKARRSFVQGFLSEHGKELAPSESEPTTRQSLDRQLSVLNQQVSAIHQDRDWLRAVGLLVGLTMTLLLMLTLATASGVERPWRLSIVFAGVIWLLLAQSGWQFQLIQVFGELWHSPVGFFLRLGVLLVVAGVLAGIVHAARHFGLLSAIDAAWLGWGLVVLALGQSVMRWPYGPLPEMYRSIMALALVGGLAVLLVKRHYLWRRVAAATAAMLAFYLLSAWLLGDEMRASDSWVSTLVADFAVGLMVAGLAWDALKNGSNGGRQRIIWGLVVLLAIFAIVYHRGQYTWMIKPLLAASLAPIILSYFSQIDLRFTRNTAMALALVFYRALGLDYRVMLLVLLVLAVLPLSGMRSSQKSVWLPIAAALATLAHYSFFYEAGHAYSFSAIDVSVAFAATRDAVNLGESFVFLAVQHMAPLLVLMAALIHFSAVNGDSRGVFVVALAFIGGFAMQSWGAFASFEYQVNNHWFTMHALPVMLFSFCGILLSGVACWVSLPPTLETQAASDDGFG